MVKFKTLEATNCFSYTHLSFNFENGISQISGTNGSGKTSLFLMLQQCLYNRNSKVPLIDNVSNDITGEKYELTLYFDKDNSEYIIKNSRKDGKITVHKDGHNISQKSIPTNLNLIEEVLGCDFETFTVLCFQESNSSLNLVEDAKDSARKDFCNRSLKFDALDDLQSKFEDKRKTLTGKSGQIELLSKQITTLESSLVEEQEAVEENWEQQESLAIGCEKARIELEESKAAYTEVTQELKGVNLQLAEVELERKDYEKRAEIEEAITAILFPEMSQEEIVSRISENEKMVSATTERIKLLEIERVKLEKIKNERVCPVLKEICYKLNSESVDEELENTSALISELSENKQIRETELKSLKKDLQIFNDRDRLVSQLNQIKIESKTLGYDVDDLKKRSNDLTVHKNSLFTENEQLEKVYKEKQQQLGEVTDFNTRQRTIKELNQKIILNNQKIRLQVDASKKELSVLEAKLELIELWLKLLGPKGYRVVKMKSFLKQLNVVMVKYLLMLSEGQISCKFFVTEDGKIDFLIKDVNKSLPYSNWSAGQKARIKLACLFSVLEILEAIGNCSFNVLCLDEVAASLDRDGKDGLYKVLEYLKNCGKAIYIISHSELFNTAFFDKTINVKMEEGISYLI